MTYCGKCGSKIEENVKYCPGCGAVMEEAGNAEEKKEELNQKVENITDKVASLNNTTDSTEDFDKKDIEQNKIMAILAYLSWLVIIPIFAAPKSKFARFHANQGLVLALTEIVWWIVQGILSSVLYSISWRLGFIVNILSLVNIAFFVMAIIGIVNAVNGRAKDLPIVGKFRILK